MRKNNKILFSIYKSDLHLGNSYGETKINAIKQHLLSSYTIQFPNITIEEVLELHCLDDFTAIKAIPKIHYFKSKYLKGKELTCHSLILK